MKLLDKNELQIRAHGYIRCMRGGKSGVLHIMLISAS
jgi:hypothetical protein